MAIAPDNVVGTVVSCWQAKICTPVESKPAGQAKPIHDKRTGSPMAVQSAVILEMMHTSLTGKIFRENEMP